MPLDRKELQKQYGIIGESPAIKQAMDKALQVAPTDITVLLQGETGVGKDVTARAIHDLSPRKSGNLVIVNCGAIPEGIIESELFGHEKGAYTGAHEARMGYFEQADGGTILLDEIVDTPKNVQVKLLRVLESGEFFRVGSSKLRTVDVRVIAATNKDLWQSVQSGDFREDLFYRLNTVTIRIPPLRERSQDILLIFHSYVSEFARKYDSVFRGMSDEARQLLLSYRWPGNIRELRNVAEQLVVLEKSQYIDEEVLKKYLKGRQKLGSADNLPMVFGQDKEYDRKFQTPQSSEMHLIYRVLLDMQHDMSDMKKMLGTLFYQTVQGGNIPKSLPAAREAVLRAARDPDQNMSLKDISDLVADAGSYADADYQEEDTSSQGVSHEEDDDTAGRSAPARESGNHDRGIADTGRDRDDDFYRDKATVSGEHAGTWSGKDARTTGTPETGHLNEDQRKAIALFDSEDLPSVEEMEKFLIQRALEKYGGNRRRAAGVLGMSERTLYRKIDQYGLL